VAGRLLLGDQQRSSRGERGARRRRRLGTASASAHESPSNNAPPTIRVVLFLGVDLAWKQVEAKETGVVALEESARVRAAGWTIGYLPTADWIEKQAEDDTLVFVDAPLIVTNPAGTQRLCEWHVGKCYGRAKVSANTTNVKSPRLGGVALREELEQRGFRYDDGLESPPSSGRIISECYPYTTIVGSELLAYDVRPTYKRPPPGMPMSEFRPIRAAACDELICRVSRLADADPPLDLRSHELTRALVDEPSPINDDDYKHREDLLDAALSAWTAALWRRKGVIACQVLGYEPEVERPAATMIAPAKAAQHFAESLRRDRRLSVSPEHR
jgi:predicted RNase H-like nuclease